MSSFWTTVVAGIGATAGGTAAVFWLWASLVTVPDNIDTFIGEMQKISRLNAYGAGAACIAAVCGLTLFLFGQIMSVLLAFIAVAKRAVICSHERYHFLT